MSNPVEDFAKKKEAESVYISLADGESVVVAKLKAIKPMTKTGFGGEEKDILRFVCEVETSEGIREKFFDNGTMRFAKEVQEKGVDIGCGFTLTRSGTQVKTRYAISDVKKAAA